MGLAQAAFLIFSVVATAASYNEQRRAANAAEDARDAQQAQAKEENRQARVKSIEAARRRRAAVIAQSEAQGALQSSSVQGALGAFQSDIAANQTLQRNLQQLENQRFSSLSEQSAALGRANTFQALSNVSSQFSRTFSQTPDPNQQQNQSSTFGPTTFGSPQN